MVKSQNFIVCHTTRGGGSAGRHLLGGEGVFTLPTGLQRIHTNSSVVDGTGGGGLQLLSRRLNFSHRTKGSLRKPDRNRVQSSGWESPLDTCSSVTLGKSLPSLSLGAPICLLWGLDHMLYDIQRICEPEVLKMESGAWGIPQTLLGTLQSKNYFHNNAKTLFCLFHFHTLMSIPWSFPEANV